MKEFAIMYPLQDQTDYTEFRYSLRSLKFLNQDLEVIVVGPAIPDWLTNVTWIKYRDIPQQKQLNIKSKIAVALTYAEKIFHLHDDCYLTCDSDPVLYPYYSFGDLRRIGEPGAYPLRKQLEAMNKPTKCFDGHQPIVYDQRFLQSFINFTSETIVKSAFCNYNLIEGIPHTDMKIMRKTEHQMVEKMIAGRPYFSTDQSGIGSCLRTLNELFPNRSKFELF